MCNGSGIVQYWGSPQEACSVDELDDAQIVVWMVWTCRKRCWTPNDLERHSAWWLSAYWYLAAKVARECKKMVKKIQKRKGSAGADSE